MDEISFPHPGIKVWETQYATIARLHYTADPDKAAGPFTYVDDVGMDLSAWALNEYQGMTNKGLYRQEYEIDPEGNQGQLVFTFKQHEAAIVVKPFPVPADWTRYYALDPHPRVPHAHLWCAVDPYGDRFYYREYWPSKIYGKRGLVPEDDNRHTIKEHMEVVKWLESAENPDNQGKEEMIRARVIDYAARAFGQGTADDEPQENFQERFEKTMRSLRMRRPYFQDAVKDREAGIAKVNEGLKPGKIERNGQFVDMARIHIFSNLPELILELGTARYPKLTALQADSQDPHSQPKNKRMHQADCCRYLEMAEPRYHEFGMHPMTVWEPGKDPDYIQANEPKEVA